MSSSSIVGVRGISFAAITAAVLAISSAGVAQTSSHSPTQAQQPSFRGDVSVVRIDTIVTDESGAFVDDLRADEFRLYEDGVLQRIEQVQLVDIGLQKAIELPDPASPSAAGERRVGERFGAGEQPETLGAMVLLIDASRLDYFAQRRFSEAWAALVEATRPYSGPKAAFAVDYLGRLHEAAPMTTDVDVLRRVGALLEDPSQGFSWQQNLAFGTPLPTGEWFLGPGTANVFGHLEDLATALSLYRGRKALIWISRGVPTNYHTRTINLRALTNVANSFNTSVYAIDPTLVTERYRHVRWTRVTSRRGPAESIRADTERSGRFRSDVIRYDGLRDSLFMVARNTGGRAYPYTTRVAEALDEIQRDTGRYYLLAYIPRDRRGDGSFREVEVEVARDDVNVRTRAGYMDFSPNQLMALQDAAHRFFDRPEFLRHGR